MSGINVKAKAYAFAFTFIRIEKVGNKELERIHTMVLSCLLYTSGSGGAGDQGSRDPGDHAEGNAGESKSTPRQPYLCGT